MARLPYKIKKNGGTSTVRTEKNIDRVMDVVEEIIENPNRFQDGTYQGGTNRKAEYIFLVEKYLRENTSEDGARLFVWGFFKIFKKDNKALKILEKEILQHGIQKLATFRIDPKSTEFSTLVNEIVGPCEFLTFDPKDTYGMTLDQFRDSIQKIYLKIQNNNQE